MEVQPEIDRLKRAFDDEQERARQAEQAEFTQQRRAERAEAANERVKAALAYAIEHREQTDPSERPRCVMCGDDHLGRIAEALDQPGGQGGTT